MTKNRIILICLGLLFLTAACEKREASEDSLSTNKTTGHDPYEVYLPTTGDPYAEMKTGLLEVFDTSNSDTAIALDKSVFLMEAGLSALFPDAEFVEFDSLFTQSMDLEFSKSGNFTSMGELKTNFTEVFNGIEAALNQNDAYAVDAIDIRFASETGSTVFFTADVVYAVNGSGVGSNSPYYWGPVPNAPYSAFAGSSSQCPFVPFTKGAWENVATQVRSVAPMNHPGPNLVTAYFNNYYMSTDPSVTGGGFRKLNGDYLVGWPNALDINHQGVVPATTCIPISNPNPGRAGQNEYAQAIVDQLYPFVGKRNYWTGLISFRMRNIGTPGTIAVWVYDTYLGAAAVTDAQNALLRSDLNLY